MPCHQGASLPLTGSEAAPSQADKTRQGGIVFAGEHHGGVVPIPGYNALPPLMRSARDPSLLLNALSGIDPTGPVMVEVPLVLNNTTFTASQLFSGWRIGFADRYVCSGQGSPAYHSAAMRRAFDILRQAGARLVPVNAQRAHGSVQFTPNSRNEIDELVAEHLLDALMSDGKSAAFHGACRSGHASLCDTLEDGTQLWFYGPSWSRDTLPTLLDVYRRISACAPN